MSARVIPLHDVDEDLVVRWRQLSRGTPDPNPFADADFVLPADRWIDPTTPRALVVVERGGELRFALAVTRVRGFRRIAVPAIAGWSHSYAPLGTPLLSPHQPEETWAEVLDLLNGMAPWAVLGLFPSDGIAARSLSAVLHRRGRHVSVLTRPRRPVARRRAGVIGSESMTTKARSELMRQRRRIADCGTGAVTALDWSAPGRDLDRAVEGFLTMERMGWKGRDGGAMACRPGHGEFFRDICRRFAAAGCLQLWSLQVGDRPIAYQCNLLAGDVMFAFKKTFDEALGQFSPGTQLLLETVSRFHADGRWATYDSCFDSATVAHDFFPDHRPLGDVLLPLSLVGRAAARATPYLAAAYRGGRKLGGLLTHGGQARSTRRPPPPDRPAPSC
jgi:CelD/BcsL family acetyltransferase involved in cellulose biosynthesis